MPDRPLDVRVDVSEFAKVLKDVKRFEPELAKQLRKSIRQAGDVAVKDVQAAVRAIPSKGHAGPSLRAGIARGVKVQVATGTSRQGVFIRATGSALPAGKKRLVQKLNRESWRHPVFGAYKVRARRTSLAALGGKESANRYRRATRVRDRATWTWTEQQGHPYFDRVIEAHAPQIERAVLDALGEAVQAIERHS